MSVPYQHQGKGRDVQKEMLSAWYKRLGSAARDGRKVAYLFVPGNVAELLRAFDIEVCYPEINALQCGIKRVSQGFIMTSEDMGYSSDVCGYVKNDIGMWKQGNQGPFGGLPKPDLLLCTYCGCTTFIKWFEQMAEYYDVPLVMLDVPYQRGGRIEPGDVAYIVGQLQEIAGTCARLTGRRYDEARLSEVLALSAEAEELWASILHSARRRPSPFDAYFEAVFFMAPIYALRGLQECVDYYRLAKAEIDERLAHGIGPVAEERFRVVIEGPPPWPSFRQFWDLFKAWGAVSVASTYSKVGGFWDRGFRHDPARPLESIAEYCLGCYTNQSLPMRSELIRSYVKEYEADAVVIHSVKSCRSFSVGQADFREEFTRARDIPTLLVESDLVDARYFQHAQLKNRIDAFFESLEHRRMVGAGPASAGPASAGRTA
jgi:benzoyl-CoA reductase subunit B